MEMGRVEVVGLSHKSSFWSFYSHTDRQTNSLSPYGGECIFCYFLTPSARRGKNWTKNLHIQNSELKYFSIFVSVLRCKILLVKALDRKNFLWFQHESCSSKEKILLPTFFKSTLCALPFTYIMVKEEQLSEQV